MDPDQFSLDNCLITCKISIFLKTQISKISNFQTLKLQIQILIPKFQTSSKMKTLQTFITPIFKILSIFMFLFFLHTTKIYKHFNLYFMLFLAYQSKIRVHRLSYFKPNLHDNKYL